MSNLSPLEQYLLELINRARADPNAEASRLGIGLNQGLSPGSISGAAKQPLAANNLLNSAAAGHSLWQIAVDQFSHTGAGGSSAGDRIEDAGYTGWTTWGENISWSGTTGTLTNNRSVIEGHHDGLFRSAGHRQNLLNDSFDEIGLGQELGRFAPSGREYNASVLTENFASDGGAPFVLGVVFDDQDGDNFFDPGEQLANVTVRTSDGRTTTTGAGGGYEIRADGNESVTVTFSGGGLGASRILTASVGDQNVKLDLNVDIVAASAPVVELGQVVMRQAGPFHWRTVTFTDPIENAVVIIGPLSRNGGDEATARVRNVTDTGFQVQVDEWDGLDGAHALETFTWMALPEGTHTLADGRTVTAGTVNLVNETSKRVHYDGFDAGPIVFAQVMTANGAQAVTDRIKGVTSGGFRVQMQEAEIANHAHLSEVVGWAAFERGGDSGGLQVGATARRFDHSADSFAFDTHDAAPGLIADMRSFVGPDTASLRYTDIGVRRASIIVEEERSQDNEKSHADETIDWLVGDLGQYDLLV